MEIEYRPLPPPPLPQKAHISICLGRKRINDIYPLK